MKNRKTLATKSGFSLVEVTELDENENEVITGYEVYGPDGNLLEPFGSLKEAQSYFRSALPEPPRSSPGMGM